MQSPPSLAPCACRPSRLHHVLQGTWLALFLLPLALATLAGAELPWGVRCAQIAFVLTLSVLPALGHLPQWLALPYYAVMTGLADSTLLAWLVSHAEPSLADALALLKTNLDEARDVAGAAPALTAVAALLFATQLAALWSFWVRPLTLGWRAGVKIALMAPLLAPFVVVPLGDNYPLSVLFLVSQSRDFVAAAQSNPDSDPVKTTRAPQASRELVLLVIGESSQAEYWQLNGYERPTTPLLQRRLEAGELLNFPRHMSTAHATFAAVPGIISPFAQLRSPAGQPLRASAVTIMKRSGFKTAWLSVQSPFPATTEAEEVWFQTDFDVFRHSRGFDDRLIPKVDAWLTKTAGQDSFAVVHTSGSHFPFEARYPVEFARWHDFGTAFPQSQTDDNYANTVLYTDWVLDQLIARASQDGRPALVVYVSDHGETLMHGVMRSQAPVDAKVLHVPFVIWASDSWRQAHSAQWAKLRDVAQRRAATSHLDVTPTLSGLLGIDYEGKPLARDLTSSSHAPFVKTPALGPDFRTPIEVLPAP